MTIVGSKVTVVEGTGKDAKTSEKEFPDQGSGVKQEVRAWVRGLIDGRADERQSPQQALGDLEILERMLRSGEMEGKVQALEHQV